jgi:protein-L-isoaspartate(D-aspartate) O-methyltransferase
MVVPLRVNNQECRQAGVRMTNDQMIREQIVARGVGNQRVLDAMRRVDRMLFVPPESHFEAYADRALPVGMGQTISQPYIVGLMTELLNPGVEDRVLEIGTGTGYQTAILAELAREVWSLEVVPELASSARSRLSELGYRNVHILERDGWLGLPEEAPFDGIIVTAAPEAVPRRLLEQLRVGGRMVVPVGVVEQDLLVIERMAEGTFEERSVVPVRFVPMIHTAGSAASG